jgi:hypothetical protein
MAITAKESAGVAKQSVSKWALQDLNLNLFRLVTPPPSGFLGAKALPKRWGPKPALASPALYHTHPQHISRFVLTDDLR